MKLRLIASLAALSAAALFSTSDARACGGCFPAQDASVVTGHRMVLSVSPTQTALWDQFQYSGDPQDFAWVLPVRSGAVLEVASDAWFETLDAATTATVLAPVLDCPSSEPIFGCGVAYEAVADRGANGGGGVLVLHEGTVGPYETVTLKATQPGVLNDWLNMNGYKIDAATQPTIDAYVNEGFDFIALRLQSSASVRQMKPVRVLTQGSDPTLPLRMVAAGSGAEVAIKLFTISEARFEAKNFSNGRVTEELLFWDFATSQSNYTELRKGLLGQNKGETWLTAYAKRGSLLSPVDVPAFMGPANYSTSKGGFFMTIAEAYVAQGLENGETFASSCTDKLLSIANSSDFVVNPCPFGAAPNDPGCGTVGVGQIDSRELACGPLDDLAVALRGLHPKDVWLTRLEANLPRAALGRDLQLSPIATAEPVENFMTAKLHINGGCPSGLPPISGEGEGEGKGKNSSPSIPTGLAVGILLLGSALLRRMRSPRLRFASAS